MSTDVGSKPAEQNAQAAEDAQKMLAELQGESGAVDSNKADGTDSRAGAKPDAGSEDVTDDKKPVQSERPRDRGNNRGRGGGRGRGGQHKGKNDRDNIKSDLTSQEVTDDPVAIRKQVEFYFSDSNLPMDKFLLGKVGGSQNNPVELQVIHSFKRMRHFQPFEAIAKALKESTFLELTDDDTAVKRKHPLPDTLSEGVDSEQIKVFEDKAMPKSVYVKGFGEEQPGTQFDIEAFFAPYGPTNAIRLRRTDDKIFKRSVFVEFESEDLAKKFLELDPKPKYKGNDLLIMGKKEYCDKKVEDIKSGKIRARPNQGRGGSGRRFEGRNGKDFKRKRDNEDNRDWRERRDQDRKNGSRDNKRRSNRDQDNHQKGAQQELDERGIPVVKPSSEGDEKSKRENQKADALAKARAAVEQDQKASGDTTAGAASDSTKKRAREEDDGADAERDSKKQDVKAEA